MIVLLVTPFSDAARSTPGSWCAGSPGSFARGLRGTAAAGGLQMGNAAAGQTLQPTALVHEAWLRLARENLGTVHSRTHFFAAAAEAMRHILINRARRKKAVKHGGGQQRVDCCNIVPLYGCTCCCKIGNRRTCYRTEALCCRSCWRCWI